MNSLQRTVPLFKRVLKTRDTVNLTSKLSCSTESKSKPEEVPEKNIVIERVNDNTVMTIGINRPERKNALDVKTAQQLAEALEEFENDKEALAGVLHGCGGNFCAGVDLHELAEYDGESEDQVPQFGPLAKKFRTLLKKPLIGACNGFTVGAGLELALICDLRVVDDTTVFGFLNRRFGVPILLGGTVRLPAIVGYGRAMEMILQGRAVNAKEALNWGLANEMVACGSALGQAVMLAKSLTKFPQKSLLADRFSAHHATFSGDQMDEKLQFERDSASHLLYEEGVAGAKCFQNGIGRHGTFKKLVEDISKTKRFDDINHDLL